MSRRRKLFLLFLLIFLFFFLSRACFHYNLKTDYCDEYFFDNPFWNTTQGRPLWLSIEDRSFLGNHFSPVLFVFALPYFIHPSPLWIFFVQALLIAGIAAIILHFGGQQLKHSEDKLLVLLLLTNVSLRYMGLTDFHMDNVMAFLLTIALYVLFTYKNIFWTTLLFISCFLAKETAGILIASYGLFLIFGIGSLRLNVSASKQETATFSRWFPGIFLIILGLGGTIYLVKNVIPVFNPSNAFIFSHYYSHFGNTISEQAAFIFLHPLKSLGFIVNGQNILYLFLLFAPLGFIPFFSATTLLIGLGPLMQNLLSNYRFQQDITTQYSTILVPVLFFALILGIKHLQDNGRWADYKKRIRPVIIFFAGLSILAFLILQAKLYIPSARTFTAHKIMRQIPPQASLSASTHLLVHLQYRKELYLFPQTGNAEYVIFEDGTPGPVTMEEYLQAIKKIQHNKKYALVTQKNGVYLYKKL